MTDQRTQLASRNALPESPDLAVFEKLTNPHIASFYLVFFTCPDYTALCPFTGKADSTIWSSTIGLIELFWRVSRSSRILFRSAITEHVASLARRDRQVVERREYAQIATHRGLLLSLWWNALRRLLLNR